MAELCIECERLWREYSAAVYEHLGLNRPANAAGVFPVRGLGPLIMVGPKPESLTALAVMRERILQHECAAHPEAT
jgi:hypothetical protein